MHFLPEHGNALTLKLRTVKTYKLLWLSVMFSMLFSGIIVVPLSIFFHGRVTHDYVITGIITAFLVSLAIVYILVVLIKQLEVEEERFRRAFETSAIGMALASLQGRWLKVNKVLCNMTGYQEQELMEMQLEDITHPDDIKVALAYRKSLLSGEFPYFHCEERFIHKEGHTVRAFLSVSLVRDARGGPLYFIVQAEDITERKKAEDALRESESRYRAIVEDQAEFVCRYVRGGILTFANNTICRYSGMQREDLLGRSFFQFIHKDYRDDLARRIEALDINNPFIIAEAWIVLPDGRKVWHRWNHHAIFNDSGEILEYQSTGNDITDLKQVQDSLMAEKNFSNAVIDSLPGIFYLFDEQGRFLRWNNNFMLVAGYTGEELSGMGPQDFFDWNDKEIVTNAIQEVFVKGHYSVDAQLVSKDGSKTPYFFTGLRHMVDDKLYLLGMGIDMSMRKLAEAEREGLIRELRESLDNVKELRGLLPICASCKNIRDDKGYWRGVEDYISSHSEALFTHSICPECTSRLYPEQYKSIMKKKKSGVTEGNV